MNPHTHAANRQAEFISNVNRTRLIDAAVRVANHDAEQALRRESDQYTPWTCWQHIAFWSVLALMIAVTAAIVIADHGRSLPPHVFHALRF